MGVRNLTTYIEDRSEQYFENYRLHDCNLIIDGFVLCYNLYNWNHSFWNTGYSYDSYGGDYDKYAEIVKSFFEMLKVCNVESLIVFGGRTASDKISRNKARLEYKMKVASQMTPDSEKNSKKNKFNKSRLESVSAGLPYVFKDILNELGLKMFTCHENPIREISSLANQLKCPILSMNSDFFVLGSMFIPFSSLTCQIKVLNDTNWREPDKNSYQFIQCQLYRNVTLLCALNKQSNHDFMLFLLPVLLGSEYINDQIFKHFFNSLEINGPRQDVVNDIFKWIRRQDSLDDALKNILDSFPTIEKRNYVSEKINHVIMTYSPVSIEPLLKHFNIGSVKKSTADLGETADNEKANLTGLELFTKRLGECRYPSFFMDMLKDDRYLLQANVDDCTRPDSNSIGFTIMSSIHNILVQNEQKRLTVFKRDHKKMKEYVLPAVTDQLPSIEEIDHLLLESRFDILLKVLEIDQHFCEIFEGSSKEWHLFLLSLKYTKSKSELDSSFIYSLVLCFIILNYVDLNINGFYRTTKYIRYIEINQNIDSTPAEQNEFPKISANDSVCFMQQCIKYFELNVNDNAETFDRGITHSLSEFRCIFLHLKHLNNVLDFPVEDALIRKIFDNTFIYNMTKNLKSVSGLKNYLNDFLQECSTIQAAFFYIIELLEKHAIL